MQDLQERLLEDLRAIGLEVTFELCLRKFSSTRFGVYNPNNNKVTLYIYEDTHCTREYPYESLLLTLVHEAIHCKQWRDPSFKRKKGIMHDVEFKQLYEEYSQRAKARLIFKEVINEIATTKWEVEVISPFTYKCYKECNTDIDLDFLCGADRNVLLLPL